MSVPFIICYNCKNWIKDHTCKAFKKIPDEILFGEFDHRKPYPNKENPTDHGIRYEPVTKNNRVLPKITLSRNKT